MRRLLYAVLFLALLIPTGSVFAEPQVIDQYEDGMWLLGEIWWTPDWLYGEPIWEAEDEVTGLPERVDAFLTRPSTLEGWPFEWGPYQFWDGVDADLLPSDYVDVDPWYLPKEQSSQRRISYAEDWLYATEWGGYYAEFLLPRDEAWFPCSFPNKWACDFEVAPNDWVYHSPQLVVWEPGGAQEGILLWDPYDTVSPLVVDIQDEEKEFGVQFQLEIIGYTWYASDIP